MFAIIKRGASGDGYFAVPNEGSSFFIPLHIFVSSNLRENQEISEEQFRSLYRLERAWRCRTKALEFLATREHNRFELSIKLKKKEYPSDVIAQVLDDLEHEHILSDERYAENFISMRLRKAPEGKPLLLGRLIQKGVDRATAEAAVNRCCDEDAMSSAILRAAEKLSKKYLDEDSLIFALQKKGFTKSNIRVALDTEIE